VKQERSPKIRLQRISRMASYPTPRIIQSFAISPVIAFGTSQDKQTNVVPARCAATEGRRLHYPARTFKPSVLYFPSRQMTPKRQIESLDRSHCCHQYESNFSFKLTHGFILRCHLLADFGSGPRSCRSLARRSHRFGEIFPANANIWPQNAPVYDLTPIDNERINHITTCLMVNP
jgi:hypothetical protein